MASQKELAAHLGVTPRRVRQMVDEGVIPGPDVKGVYDMDACRLAAFRHLRDVASGRGAGAEDLTKARTGLARLQSERLELKLAILRHEFCKNSETVRIMTETFAEVNDKLWSVPPLCARDLANRALPYEEVKAAIDKRMAEAMEALQPDPAVIKAEEATQRWIAQHMGRL
jgi:phage terminase Nu1 subunit (DNA packaging protein)